MKQFILILLVLILACNGFYAQLFTKINTGPLVNTASDSRGVNCIDVNNDGYDDVFITNGPASKDHNLLYINNGNGSFTKDSLNGIVQDTSSFDGATFGDVDNDGDLDAYVVTWYNYKNYFYRNTGAGTFSYEPANVSGATGYYSEVASWGDYDKDGLLDLYVTNSGGNKKNLLFNNIGAGTFTQVVTGTMVNDALSSRSMNWTDYDNDNDLDIFVSNESNQLNNLYQNNNDGSFTKITNISPTQSYKSSMTSSWADIDNDGDLDLFVGNSQYFAPENNQLFLNNNNGTFTAVLSGQIVNDGGCTYGSSFADYDNDGDIDLFVSNGYFNGIIKNFLYSNNGAGVFTQDSLSMPSYTTPCSYGCAWADLNNDGFQDLVVSTCKSSSTMPQPNNILFMNNGNGNNWLEVKLSGTTSNKSAIGAKIYVSAVIGGSLITQMREVSAQTGQCGQNSLTQHFGLGDATNIQSMLIKWPSGIITSSNSIPVNTLLTAIELDPVGIISHKKNQLAFSCYPNPSSGVLHFEILNPEHVFFDHISINSVYGKAVKQIELKTGETFIKVTEYINPGSLEQGIYIATLYSREGLRKIKFSLLSN